MDRLRSRSQEVWDVDVKPGVGRMTRSGAMLEEPYDIIPPRDWAVQGSNLVFGTRGACRKQVQILACWYLVPCYHLFDRMIRALYLDTVAYRVSNNGTPVTDFPRQDLRDASHYLRLTR